jgi:hypothetical protein
MAAAAYSCALGADFGAGLASSAAIAKPASTCAPSGLPPGGRRHTRNSGTGGASGRRLGARKLIVGDGLHLAAAERVHMSRCRPIRLTARRRSRVCDLRVHTRRLIVCTAKPATGRRNPTNGLDAAHKGGRERRGPLSSGPAPIINQLTRSDRTSGVRRAPASRATECVPRLRPLAGGGRLGRPPPPPPSGTSASTNRCSQSTASKTASRRNKCVRQPAGRSAAALGRAKGTQICACGCLFWPAGCGRRAARHVCRIPGRQSDSHAIDAVAAHAGGPFASRARRLRSTVFIQSPFLSRAPAGELWQAKQLWPEVAAGRRAGPKRPCKSPLQAHDRSSRAASPSAPRRRLAALASHQIQLKPFDCSSSRRP